jgi:hypothetical protein
MIHVFSVVVETDDKHIDAPNTQAIANEIQSSLEWGGEYTSGIEHVKVAPITGLHRQHLMGEDENV